MSLTIHAASHASVSPAQAYDQHLNMVLSDVEEVITTMELDEETFEEIYKVSWLKSPHPLPHMSPHVLLYLSHRPPSEVFRCYSSEVMA